ncbi:MAG: hypothetical protein HOH04_04920 [Rhodospirillaceae bacterium]|jgi:hypothetical protein|nr:hypothetical protein [Rhodospirillaceae bacterium]
MFRVITAHTEDPDANGALDDLIIDAQRELGEVAPKAGLLFSAIDLDHGKLLAGIKRTWPSLELIGCTTDGEMSSGLGFSEDSTALILFSSSSVDISAGLGRNLGDNPEEACRQALNQASAKTDKKAALCVAVPESLTSDGQIIVEAMTTVLGDQEIPLFGAAAGDHWRFQGTNQFFGTEVVADSIPILLFSGPLSFSYAVASGRRGIGEPGVVTRSEGPVVQEIDSEPAIEFYRKFMGSNAAPNNFPLALIDKKGQIEALRASPGIVDAESGAITFVASVQQGSQVQVTVADRDAIINGCRASIEDAKARFPKGKSPQAALFFSCAGRRGILGSRAREEAEIASELLGPELPHGGFYGYGEIGPYLAEDRRARFHNETFVSLLLGE